MWPPRVTSILVHLAGVALAAPAPVPTSNPFLSEGVLTAIVTTLGGILTLILGKLSFDLARVKKSSHKTHVLSAKVEHSINNRETPLSDRLDAVMAAVQGVATVQTEQGKTLDALKEIQEEHTKDLRGLRKDDGQLRGEVREVRTALSEHLAQTEESMAIIRKVAPLVQPGATTN